MRNAKLSATACEREVLKYLPSVSLRPYDPGNVAASPIDTTLTALAQLGTLRLKATRCFISLFDTNYQHILTEATPTLSLQHDEIHDDGDELWYGAALLPRHLTPCSIITDRHAEAYHADQEMPDSVTIISDIHNAEEYKAMDIATRTPAPRFIASAAVVSPRGTIIGSYAIVDEKPRAGLDAKQIQFMRDMAATIMSHLVLARTREEYRQGERMIRGMGSFVEGRGSVRNWRAITGHAGMSYESSCKGHEGEGQLDERQQTSQRADDRLHGIDPCTDQEQSPPPASNVPTVAVKFPSDLRLDLKEFLIPTDGEDADHDADGGEIAIMPTSGHRAWDKTPPSDFAHSVASTDGTEETRDAAAAMFARATNIIRESLEVEGAVIYDASTSEWTARAQSQASSNRDGLSSSESVSTDRDSDSSVGKGTAEKLCPVIAFSDSQQSSVNSETSEKEFMNFPEQFIHSLIQMYPQGKVFHFDGSGQLSSGSSESEGPLDTTNRLTSPAKTDDVKLQPTQIKRKKKRRLQRSGIGPLLSRIFPGARSIGFFSLWDNNEERWHAAGIIWTRQPNRYFTEHGHLSFLKAIGATMMAELARLEALASVRAKTNLLGCISHELRSPLHGILGCVEVLEGSPQTALQTDMLQSMESCGRTLLDTIEQLLDFSKINNVTSRRKQRPRRHAAFVAKNEASIDMSATRLDIITEEVVAVVAAGAGMRKSTTYQSSQDDRSDFDASPKSTPRRFGNTIISSPEPSGPTIILDIDKSMDLAFLTHSGSWRRIVMNLFANSLKYTRHGHIKISLSAKLVRSKRGQQVHKITLTVADTGQGISAQYLRNRLFKPFSQEDNLASGTGLGLSIVKQIVDTLHGKINVDSVQDVGTKISVAMYMEGTQNDNVHSKETSKVNTLKELAQRLQGQSACFLGCRESLPLCQDGAIGDSLQDVLKKTAKDWYGLRLCTESEAKIKTPNLYLIVEPDPLESSLDFDSMLLPHMESVASERPLLFVICRSLHSKQRIIAASQKTIPSSWSVHYITQPCGVHKLAGAIALGMEQQSRIANGNPCQLPNDDSMDSSSLLRTPSSDVNSGTQASSLEPMSASEDKSYFPHFPTTGPTVTRDNGLSDALDSGLVKTNSTSTLPSEQSKSSTPQTLPNLAVTQDDTYLLVDDNAINLKILATHLKRRKAPYVTAENGLIALNTYTSDPSSCRIILMDISMPVMDGLESTRAIRALEKRRRLQPSIIIVVTGLASAKIQEETHASGADAYLAKPVGLKELDEAIARLRAGPVTPG